MEPILVTVAEEDSIAIRNERSVAEASAASPFDRSDSAASPVERAHSAASTVDRVHASSRQSRQTVSEEAQQISDRIDLVPSLQHPPWYISDGNTSHLHDSSGSRWKLRAEAKAEAWNALAEREIPDVKLRYGTTGMVFIDEIVPVVREGDVARVDASVLRVAAESSSATGETSLSPRSRSSVASERLQRSSAVSFAELFQEEGIPTSRRRGTDSVRERGGEGGSSFMTELGVPPPPPDRPEKTEDKPVAVVLPPPFSREMWKNLPPLPVLNPSLLSPTSSSRTSSSSRPSSPRSLLRLSKAPRYHEKIQSLEETCAALEARVCKKQEFLLDHIQMLLKGSASKM